MCLGVYLDNPEEVPPSECRARIGVIVDDEDAAECVLPSVTYRSQETAQTQLPYFDLISVLIAVYKAYPAFSKFCKNRGASADEYVEMIEVYDKSKRTVTFHAIASKP